MTTPDGATISSVRHTLGDHCPAFGTLICVCGPDISSHKIDPSRWKTTKKTHINYYGFPPLELALKVPDNLSKHIRLLVGGPGREQARGRGDPGGPLPPS